MKEYWRLSGKFGGTTFEIFGTEDVLRGAFNAWLEWERMDDITRETGNIDPIIVIDGFTDTFDRAPETVAMRKGDIEAMSLSRMA